MPATYEPIATVAPNGATVDFTNIPQTYTDLVMVVYGRGAGTFTNVWNLVVLNNDSSGSSYSRTVLNGDGSSATSFRETNYAQLYTMDGFPGGSVSANIFATGIYHFMNYSNTTNWKPVLSTASADRNGAGQVTMTMGMWRSNSAVNRISLFVASGNNTFANGSQITLYGIKAA